MRQETDAWDSYLRKLEQDLQSVGDDSQLSRIDMQNFMQRQQQTLTLLSNLSKQIHTTSMAVVRNRKAWGSSGITSEFEGCCIPPRCVPRCHLPERVGSSSLLATRAHQRSRLRCGCPLRLRRSGNSFLRGSSGRIPRREKPDSGACPSIRSVDWIDQDRVRRVPKRGRAA
jgi:hypothetical protein